MKLKKLAAGLGMALSLIGTTAHAAVLSFEDDNIDFLLNSDGTAKTTGTLAIGDILVSIFEIGTYTIDGVPAIPDGQELTGVVAIRLAAGTGTVADPWVFADTIQGLSAWSDTPLGIYPGATLAMFFNSTASNLDLNFASNPAASCTSLADCITEATNGTLVQVDGFDGDTDEFWRAVATIPGGGDVDVVGGTSGAVGVAQFTAAQTTLFNLNGTIGPQPVPGPAGPGDDLITGPLLTGPILGGAGLNPGITADGAFARSDFDITKKTVVPEPGSIALLGLGLSGLAFYCRKKHVA